MRVLILITIFTIISYVRGQDLQGTCITCDDVSTTCELNCIMPKFRTDQVLAWPYNKPETAGTMTTCIETCSTSRTSCTDTDEATTCQTCMTTCTESYDESMLGCLQGVDSTTKATYGTEQADCSIEASYSMDLCTAECYPSDMYNGWTPEAEEGIAKAGNTKFQLPIPKSLQSKLKNNPDISISSSTSSTSSYTKSKMSATKTNMQLNSESSSSNSISIGGVLAGSGLVAIAILAVGAVILKTFGGPRGNGGIRLNNRNADAF